MEGEDWRDKDKDRWRGRKMTLEKQSNSDGQQFFKIITSLMER